jgi:hypothetical protein
MTPQVKLRAYFSELTGSLGIDLSVRCQTGKFYFIVQGEYEDTNAFMQSTFPEAWITSAAGPEVVYGLPLVEVERVLAKLHFDSAWLQINDAAPRKIAQHIRDEGTFEHLPNLADALVEGGCSNAEILSHCRASAPHRETCWVVELLLGPNRRRRRKFAPE